MSDAWENFLDDHDDAAEVTLRIIDQETGVTVGYVHAWEDGVTQPLWLNGVRTGVRFVDIDQDDK